MAGNGRFFGSLAELVATGSSVKSAAEQIGCSERHAYRIAARPDFRRQVSTIRSAAVNTAVGSLSLATLEAVSTLRDLMGENSEPNIRLNAAKAVLIAIGPLTELGDIRQRLDAVEQQTVLKIAQ